MIGGSEEANEEIRNKYLGSDFKLPESAKPYYDLCVDSKSISQLELTSENYNDIMKIKGMPASCLSGNYGEQVIKDMKDMMHSYYQRMMYNRKLKIFVWICVWIWFSRDTQMDIMQKITSRY